MSKKSRKVVDKSKINDVLNNKGKEMLGEAFEGINSVVSLGAIHNIDGFSSAKYVDNTQLNETIPAFPKEYKEFEKASVMYAKSIDKFIKALAKAGYRDEAMSIKKQYAIKVDSDFENLIDNTLAKLS
tara:strand:+ start:892 stop:1275 length:384 start_codon:yes stop_codon:yes gene_type:complete